MIVSLVAAASDNDVIGKDNWMPWNLPAELAHFREITRGKTVIMGRKTYDAVGRPMPKRHNIVVSRQKDLAIPGVDVVASVEEAIARAQDDGLPEACVIGGEQIYRLALPLADRIYLSRVHAQIDGGEAFFPQIDEREWKEIDRRVHPADPDNSIPFTMLTYERVRGG